MSEPALMRGSAYTTATLKLRRYRRSWTVNEQGRFVKASTGLYDLGRQRVVPYFGIKSMASTANNLPGPPTGTAGNAPAPSPAATPAQRGNLRPAYPPPSPLRRMATTTRPGSRNLPGDLRRPRLHRHHVRRPPGNRRRARTRLGPRHQSLAGCIARKRSLGEDPGALMMPPG